MTCSNQYPELHQNTEPHYLHLHWCLLRLWFQPRIKNPSHWDQYEKWRVWKPVLLYQAVYDLGSYDMLMGFSPHTVCSGRFMRFAVVLYRICVSVLWERWNELMLEICKLLWVFFFSFQTLLLTFFFRGSFVLNDFAFPDKYSTLPRLFFFFHLTIRWMYYYFCLGCQMICTFECLMIAQEVGDFWKRLSLNIWE